MLASLHAAVRPANRRAVPDWAVALPLLVAAALFMFVDARVPPIYLWDESRLAVNALEMNRRGWSLVTTYGFAPDLWNTKPPLMIWLMNGSMTLFGRSEIPLRLPSMVAAMGTLMVVFAFVRRVTHSVAPAALALFLLAASVAFFGRHGARSGDFDALLCFFTTSFLALLFFAVHRRAPPPRLLIMIGALLAAAAMTKTIAAFVPGVGVGLYVLLVGRVRRTISNWRYAAVVASALVPLLLFYAVRERAAPGYLQAVWFNDFVGRYQIQLGPLQRSRWFFFHEIGFNWMFSAGPLALLAPLGLIGRRGQSRQALLFALCVVVGQLAIISVPSTRLIQYMLPALPWMAIACAITMADRLPRYFARPDKDRALRVNPALALVAITIVLASVAAGRLRYEMVPKQDFYPQASYGNLFAALHQTGIDRVTVADEGMNVAGLRSYAPQLRFYALLWNDRGMRIRATDHLPVASSTRVASCSPLFVRALLATGAEPLGTDGCALRGVAPHEASTAPKA